MAFARRPQVFCNFKCINFVGLPPDPLVPVSVEFSVMEGAEWHGEFVRDLSSESSRLSEFEVMRMRPVSAADQAGLRGNKGEVTKVASPQWLGNSQG